MNRFLTVLLFVALAISTSEAVDYNHQEQNFGKCGHRLTKTQCDAYAQSKVSSDSVAEDNANKPQGCYVVKASNEYKFNSNAANPDCSATDVCICDKLVGGFDATGLSCNAQGFDPTFTYTPVQTQSVVIDIVIGDTNEDKCKSQKSQNDNQATVLAKGDFNTSYSTAGHIPYGAVGAGACGGTLSHVTDSQGTKQIRYQVGAVATVKRVFRTHIQRLRKFTFSIECLMERNVTASTTNGFTVATQLIAANEEEDVSKEFTFSASLKFYESTYQTEQSGAVTANNNEKVYAEVAKGDNQGLFVYSVQNCYATKDNDPSDDQNSDVKDTFFENYCPKDETMDFAKNGDKFQFEIQAFSFTSSSDAVYLHCDLKVCLNDNGDKAGECDQMAQSACNANNIQNNRRRRDVSYESLDNGSSQKETITSAHPLLLEGSQFHAPQCGGEGFVYDRVAQECSRKNLIKVKGIRLSSDHFKVDYYNASSKAFKEMAREKEYLLWVLVKATGQDKAIRGIQVVGAQPGGLKLDVVVKHSDIVTPEQAFGIFKDEVIGAPSRVTRVQSVLQIVEKKLIEYIPIVSKEDKSDSEKIILIVVIAVLFVVVMIAGVTLFAVKQARRKSPQEQPASGFENKGIDA